jgi:hypothetical protein
MRVRFELSYYSSDGRTLVASTATPGGDDAIMVDSRGGEVEFSCAMLPLAPGSYYLGAVVKDATSGHAVGWWDGGTMLHVGVGEEFRGQLFIPHDWRIHVSHRPARVG